MIFDPEEHEPLAGDDWDEAVAGAFVDRIVRETDDAFDTNCTWPLHPEDRYCEERESYRGIYCGTAGTMWALTHLARTRNIPLRHDYAGAIARCEESYRAQPAETNSVGPSYFLGTVGIMAARYAITGDSAILDRLDIDMRANVGNPTREALWGSPGTALAALLLRERDGVDPMTTCYARYRTSFGRRGSRLSPTADSCGNKTCTDAVVAMSVGSDEPNNSRCTPFSKSTHGGKCLRCRHFHYGRGN